MEAHKAAAFRPELHRVGLLKMGCWFNRDQRTMELRCGAINSGALSGADARSTEHCALLFAWDLHLTDAQYLIDSAASVLGTARPCAESPAPPVAHHLQPTRSWRGVIGSRSADLADAG